MTVKKFSQIRLRLPPKYEDLRETFDTLLRYLDDVSAYIDTADVPPGPPIAADEFSVVIDGDVTYSGANGSLQSAAATATVTGGTAPLVYQWTVANSPDNTDGAQIAANTPLAVTTTFGSVGTDASLYADAWITVTDAASRSATASISVTATHGTPP